jgi:hypothetical protein
LIDVVEEWRECNENLKKLTSGSNRLFLTFVSKKDGDSRSETKECVDLINYTKNNILTKIKLSFIEGYLFYLLIIYDKVKEVYRKVVKGKREQWHIILRDIEYGRIKRGSVECEDLRHKVWNEWGIQDIGKESEVHEPGEKHGRWVDDVVMFLFKMRALVDSDQTEERIFTANSEKGKREWLEGVDRNCERIMGGLLCMKWHVSQASSQGDSGQKDDQDVRTDCCPKMVPQD